MTHPLRYAFVCQLLILNLSLSFIKRLSDVYEENTVLLQFDTQAGYCVSQCIYVCMDIPPGVQMNLGFR